jgi:hypothetical protein
MAIAVAIACSEKKGPVNPPACDCPYQGDLDGSGVLDAFDVIATIDVVANGHVDPVDPACSHIGRADCNCDCVADSADVDYLIESAFANGPRPCNPCEAGNECPRVQVALLLARR